MLTRTALVAAQVTNREATLPQKTHPTRAGKSTFWRGRLNEVQLFTTRVSTSRSPTHRPPPSAPPLPTTHLLWSNHVLRLIRWDVSCHDRSRDSQCDWAVAGLLLCSGELPRPERPSGSFCPPKPEPNLRLDPATARPGATGQARPDPLRYSRYS